MAAPKRSRPAATDRRRRRRWWLWGVAAAVAAMALYARRAAAAVARRTRPHRRGGDRPSAAVLIVNGSSGDGRAAELGLEAAARRAGIRVIHLEEADDLADLARSAIEAGADAIGVAGGDGTLGPIAAVAAELDVPLFCVPVGTKNHFALDLGLDRDDPLRALDAVDDGEEVLVDCARAGDRAFVNNLVLGWYSEAVHQDGYRDRKELALADAMTGDPGPDGASAPEVRFRTSAGAEGRTGAVTLISNNPYVLSGPPDYGRRLRLDEGTLGIISIGGQAGPPLRRWEARCVQLDAEQPIRAAIDGEPVTLDRTVEIEIWPGRLRVLVPAGTRPGYTPAAEAVISGLSELAQLAGLGPPDDPDEPAPG